MRQQTRDRDGVAGSEEDPASLGTIGRGIRDANSGLVLILGKQRLHGEHLERIIELVTPEEKEEGEGPSLEDLLGGLVTRLDNQSALPQGHHGRLGQNHAQHAARRSAGHRRQLRHRTDPGRGCPGMMTFRKLAANSDGKLIRAYMTENTPEPEPGADLEPGARADPGGRLTAYYTGRDGRASWGPGIGQDVADALGIDPSKAPTNLELDRLFETKRGDTGERWETASRPREISAYDLTVSPHKSVSLAAEFAQSPAEAAAV
ncbi:MAG: relaxase domain-containing protein, partial [Janthinobacterium lividum]